MSGYVLGVPRRASGYLVLELLAAGGWEIAVTGREGGGVKLSARLGDELVEREGDQVADVVLFLYEDARRRDRAVS